MPSSQKCSKDCIAKDLSVFLDFLLKGFAKFPIFFCFNNVIHCKRHFI